MSHEQVFGLAGLAALIGWVLLAAAPLRRAPLVAAARVLGVVLAAAYAVLIATAWGTAEGGGFGSLAEVKALFTVDGLLLAGWVHYLAFDLWVGAWEVEDAGRAGVSWWLVLPCLALTFLFGPVGLLLYLAVRSGRLAIRKAA